jgi:probable HAF family extracellular repeat protein
MKKQFIIMMVIVSILVGSVQIIAATQYTITDLGTLGGTYSSASGINNWGQVVGTSKIAGDSRYHAFLYSDGVMQDLGTLGGTNSFAYSINNNGQVVGVSDITGSMYHAFLYSGGTMQYLGTLGGREYSYGFGVNDSGQVVGYSGGIGYGKRAFLYSDGVIQDLGTLGNNEGSSAYAINNIGQVVGKSYITDGSAHHAFLYSNGVMQDLGTLGGNFSWATGINDNSQVVGWAHITGDSAHHAFLYSDGVMQDLGTLGGTYSWASGINNNCQVVGWSQIAGDSDTHAFLYSSGEMQDLNTLSPSNSGWIIYDVLAINDFGQIVGRGINPEGYERAFLLSPDPLPATQILTVRIEPNDLGIDTVDPNIGQHIFYQNSTANLDATKFVDCPSVLHFDHWEGDVAEQNSAQTTVVMDTDKTVIAVFVDGAICGDECHPNDLLGDFNHDCIIDFNDFAAFAGNWLVCTKPECD